MSDKIITLDNLDTFKTKIESEIDDKQDELPSGNNDTYLHKNATTGALEWSSVGIPTVTITASQVTSQDPLEVQLTDAQYNIFANNKQVILDLSALEQPTVVWDFQIDGSSTMYFGFISAHSDTTLDSNLIYIDKSTKVATYYNNTIAGGGMTNPMTTAGDIIVGDASGAPSRLGIGTSGKVLKIDYYNNISWLTDAIILEMTNCYTLTFRNENSGSTSNIIAYGIYHDVNYNYYKYYNSGSFDDLFRLNERFDKVIKFYCTSADSNDTLTSGQLYDLTSNQLLTSGHLISGHEYLLLSNITIECFD